MELNALEARLRTREPGLMDATGRYAVLVPLVERAGELCLLYEVRAGSLHRQPGEVCFPGGKIEAAESPEECALRETEEELGIQRADLQIMGRLDFIAHRANFILYPILAKVAGGALDSLRLNPAEVGEVFFVPVEHLLKNPPQVYRYQLTPKTDENFPYARLGIAPDYRWQPGGEEVPVYPWEGHAIWGLTGRITRHLIALLREAS